MVYWHITRLRTRSAFLFAAIFLSTSLLAQDLFPPQKGFRVSSKQGKRPRLTSRKSTKSKPAKKFTKHQQKELASRRVRRFLSRQYEDPSLQEKKVSITLQKTDIRDAIMLIGQNAGLSFLIDPDVRGSVQSMHLSDTPLSAALRALLQSNDPELALVKDKDLLRIVSLDRASEIFEQIRDLSIEHATVSLFRTSWDEGRKAQIEKMWQGILGDEHGNPEFYLVFDEGNRKIFFCAYQEQVSRFKRFLREIDTLIPQVKIEARFICAEKGFEENIGLSWSGVYNRHASIGRGIDFIGVMDWALNFLPTPNKCAKGCHLPIVFGGSDLNTKRLNLVLNAAENRDEIKTILKPVVLTNNLEPAKILVGENVPIQTMVEESVEGRLRNITTAEYKDIGIQLQVTPTVLPDRKTVQLDIFIENSHQSDVNPGKKSSYPTIRTTRSQTTVRIGTGETAMISGLSKDHEEHYKRKSPLLGEIPLVGWMFRGRRTVARDMQLLIFITPTVV